MNKVFILFAMLFFSSLLSAQNKKSTVEDAPENAHPTKYATVLYASQVTDTSGNNKLLAAHFRNKGGGISTWQKDIKEAGSYKIALSYATHAAGTTAKIYTSETNALTAVLKATSGYYISRKNWYEFNCERKLLPGELTLVKGLNTVTLQLVAGSPADEISIYTIDLIPVAKKTAIEKDWQLSQKMGPSKDWLANASYGLMFHWTSQSVPEQGNAKPYAEAVHDFDVSAFVKMVEKTGAGYVIFTTNHAEPYFPAPLQEWEKIYPGHTAKRDLVKDIADSLEQHNIKLILYMASHIYARYDSVNDDEFNRLNYTLVKEIGERYKEKVAGYWFDGWYQSYEKHPLFDFEKFYNVCKAGNPNRLVALNTWLYPANTAWQDYWAGEVYTIGSSPAEKVWQKGPGYGLQAQSLIVMEKENWYHDKLNTKIPSPDLKADELIQFITQSKGKGSVTVNMQIYQDGRVGEEALAVMEQVKKAIRK